MGDSYRQIAGLGVLLMASSAIFAYADVYTQQALVGLSAGFVYIIGAWYFKPPTNPPASIGYWLAVGDPPAYQEMSARQLYFQIQWLRLEYRDKTHIARPFEQLVGLTKLEKYTAEEIETELSNAIEELQSRDSYIGTDVDLDNPL